MKSNKCSKTKLTTGDRLEGESVEAPVADPVQDALDLPVQDVVQDGLVQGEAARVELLSAPFVHGQEAAGAGVPPPRMFRVVVRYERLKQGPVLVGHAALGCVRSRRHRRPGYGGHRGRARRWYRGGCRS